MNIRLKGWNESMVKADAIMSWVTLLESTIIVIIDFGNVAYCLFGIS